MSPGVNSNLSPPPKFQGTMPGSIGEWVSFFRWLTSLWKVASNSIGAQQSITISPKPASAAQRPDAATIEAYGRQIPPVSQEPDAAAIEGYGRQPVPASQEPDAAAIEGWGTRPPTKPGDDLSSLVEYALAKPPYPLRSSVSSVIRDTHAHRINYAAAAYDGWWYWETSNSIPDTDRTSLYLSVNGIWEYVGCEMQDASSTLANLPTDLGSDDAGFCYRNSFFDRLWEWNGSAWHYADGGLGAGAQVATISSLSPPSGGLWQACDGSSVACALDNATITNLSASDTSAFAGSNPMIEGGAGGSQVSATAPTVVLTTGSAQSGSSVTVVTGVSVEAPSESNGGLPLRISMAWWMRR